MNPLFLVAAGVAIASIIFGKEKNNDKNRKNVNNSVSSNSGSEPRSTNSEYRRRKSDVVLTSKTVPPQSESQNEVYPNRPGVSTIQSNSISHDIRGESSTPIAINSTPELTDDVITQDIDEKIIKELVNAQHKDNLDGSRNDNGSDPVS